MVVSKGKPHQEEEDDDDGDDGDGEDEMELPPEIMKRVDALRKLHNDVEAIEEEYKAERIELEKKFEGKLSVLYEGRKNIVSGAVEVENNPEAGTNSCNSYKTHEFE